MVHKERTGAAFTRTGTPQVEIAAYRRFWEVLIAQCRVPKSTWKEMLACASILRGSGTNIRYLYNVKTGS